MKRMNFPERRKQRQLEAIERQTRFVENLKLTKADAEQIEVSEILLDSMKAKLGQKR